MVNNEAQTPTPAAFSGYLTADPFRWVGRIMNGVGMLFLLQECAAVQIRGALATWFEAYEMLVRYTVGLAFGWIDFAYFRVTRLEQHAILIGLIIGASLFRAYVRMFRDEGDSLEDAMEEASGQSFSFFLYMVIPPVLFPAYISVPLMALVCGSACFGERSDDPEVVLPPARFVLQEIVGAIGILIILLLVNYTLFRPGSG